MAALLPTVTRNRRLSGWGVLLRALAVAAVGLNAAPGRTASSSPSMTAGVAMRGDALAEGALLSAALDAARRRDVYQARASQARLTDPVARKIVDWALIDIMGDQLSDADLRSAAQGLDDWPRAEARRQALTGAWRGYGDDGADAAFRRRKLAMNEALRRGDARSAYQALAGHGQTPGSVEYAEIEFFAGWLALNKLHDPKLAETHFARLDAAVKSPVSRARAAYWRGRAAESVGDTARAQIFYEQGAAHSTTFYGQLAAQRAGRREIILAPDPRPTAQDRQSFENSQMARAIRLLAQARERRLVREFALHYGGQVKTAGELVLLVDELKALDEQEVSLLAYRRAAQRGLILHDRGYPLVQPPFVRFGAEPAWVLAITRQESQFDPRVRSAAGASGMMQILPATGRRVAQAAGIAWSDSLLFDAQANMRLGSLYLGDLTQGFGGSYLMAAAGYNAGPRRPPEWVGICGDPRASGTDPLDFVECIPFGETRNYVMNVMANYQVYRARLNGGRAMLTASEALRTGPRS